MSDRFAGIIEVATASKARVNLYLEAGYRLLAIKQQALWTSTRTRPAEGQMMGRYRKLN